MYMYVKSFLVNAKKKKNMAYTFFEVSTFVSLASIFQWIAPIFGHKTDMALIKRLKWFIGTMR